jgi:hypothetical protein
VYVGISDKFVYRDWLVTAGDSLFALSSGNLALSEPVRGVSARRKFKKTEVEMFSGLVGAVYSSPYIFGLGGHSSFGGGFAVTQEFGHLRIGTIQASAQGRKTSLEGATYERGHIRLREQAGLLEGTKMLNGGVTYSSAHLGADVGRATYVLQPTPNSPAQRADVSDVSISGMVSHYNGSASLYHSNVNTGTAVSVGARFGGLGVSASDYSSKAQRTGLLMVSENARHWNLVQMYTRDLRTGSNTFNFGGGYSSNSLSFSIGWNEMYFPILNKPFQCVLTAQISIHFHSLSMNVGSIVNPGGKIDWATYGNDYAQVHVPLPNVGSGPSSARIVQSGHSGKFVIEGIVKDEKGLPVEGASITVGRDTLYSDTQGHFSVHTRKKNAQALGVDTGNFMSGDVWKVLSSPATVVPGQAVVIIVARGA